MADWKLEQTEYRNVATQKTRSGFVEADFEEPNLQVDVENGSGYLWEHTTAYIPVEVLVKLLTHAGYTVEKRREALEERGPSPEDPVSTANGPCIDTDQYGVICICCEARQRASKTTSSQPDQPTLAPSGHAGHGQQCCTCWGPCSFLA